MCRVCKTVWLALASSPRNGLQLAGRLTVGFVAISSLAKTALVKMRYKA